MSGDNTDLGETAAWPIVPPLHRGQSLFLDFDGTLVDIAAAPDLVRVAPEVAPLLTAAALLLDGAVAIVSGRPAEELARLLAPFSGVVVGQHGREFRQGEGNVIRCPDEPALARIRAPLADFAACHDGVFLEDKGGTLALHYREAPSLAQACRAFAKHAILASDGGLAAVDGKMVVDIVPRPCGKGRAIADLLAAPPFHGSVPVFVGDDTADEDGFVVVDRLGGISVHVGDGSTLARHRLRSVGDVLAWLARSVTG
jgi:trehalose 6-phosphate phosphatase